VIQAVCVLLGAAIGFVVSDLLNSSGFGWAGWLVAALLAATACLVARHYDGKRS